MIQNNINNLNISKMGLGIMRHNSNQQYTKQLIEYALNNKINYFEACDFYLQNACEIRLGDALKQHPRTSYKLCDKFPLSTIPYFIQKNKNWNLNDYFNNQLAKCRTDYFDVYLIQALDERNFNYLEKYQIIDFFLKQKEQGKIKLLGFSFHGKIDILKQLLEMKCWDIVQFQLNYYDWILGEAKELYFLTKEYNLPIITMGPTKGGLLINNLPKKSLDRLKENNINPVYLCYSFLETLDNVKIILSGAETYEMIKDNLNYFENESHKLTPEEWQHIKQNIQDYQEQSLIQCTGCRYCVQRCPANLPIDKIFKEYNNFIQSKDLQSREFLYQNIHSSNSTQNCKNCGQCVKICPQHLNIPEIFHKQIFPVRR